MSAPLSPRLLPLPPVVDPLPSCRLLPGRARDALLCPRLPRHAAALCAGSCRHAGLWGRGGGAAVARYRFVCGRHTLTDDGAGTTDRHRKAPGDRRANAPRGDAVIRSWPPGAAACPVGDAPRNSGHWAVLWTAEGADGLVRDDAALGLSWQGCMRTADDQRWSPPTPLPAREALEGGEPGLRPATLSP